MLEFQKTVLIPGDEVTRINKDLATEMTVPSPPGEVMHSVQEQITDGVQLRVVVRSREADTPTLEVYLLNDAGEELRHEHGWSLPFDQDYDLGYEDVLYRLTIERGAVVELTPEIKAAYLAIDGDCPHCGGAEVGQSRMHWHDDGGGHTDLACCACGAEWRDHYKLDSVESLTPPTQNIMPDHS